MYIHLTTNTYTNLVEDFNTSVSVIDRAASKDILVRMWKTGTNVTEQDLFGTFLRKTPDHVFHLPLLSVEKSLTSPRTSPSPNK